MCEILVRATSGSCSYPTANPRRGMPVVVKPDGHSWGTGERLPEYVVIRIPGVSEGVFLPYIVRWETVNGPDSITSLGRRRYLVAESIVAAAVSAGGTYTRTRNQLTRNMVDRAA